MPANPKSRIPIVTLLTDFGLQDTFVAEMKGAILRRCPAAQVVDITHEVPPFDIVTAARRLRQAIRAFPRGTVHLVVVDPGVGGNRRALILKAGGHYFVGPDNGVFTFPVRDDPRYKVYAILRQPGAGSPTFQGRDLFAPVAAALASGDSPRRWGSPATHPVLLRNLDPVRGSGNTWIGAITGVDRFGNLETNLAGGLLGRYHHPILQIGKRRITRLVRTFSDIRLGELGFTVNSSGFLEIFQRQASAQGRIRIRPGAQVRLRERETK